MKTLDERIKLLNQKGHPREIIRTAFGAALRGGEITEDEQRAIWRLCFMADGAMSLSMLGELQAMDESHEDKEGPSPC